MWSCIWHSSSSASNFRICKWYTNMDDSSKCLITIWQYLPAIDWYQYSVDTAHIVCRAGSVKWLSIRPSVCPIIRQQQHCVVDLLLSAVQAGNIDRQCRRLAATALQHGVQQQNAGTVMLTVMRRDWTWICFVTSRDGKYFYALVTEGLVLCWGLYFINVTSFCFMHIFCLLTYNSFTLIYLYTQITDFSDSCQGIMACTSLFNSTDSCEGIFFHFLKLKALLFLICQQDHPVFGNKYWEQLLSSRLDLKAQCC